MPRTRLLLALTIATILPAPGRAGLYYSGEPLAELPSQWRGFLLDQKTLRSIAVPPNAGGGIGPVRQQYLNRAEELAKKVATGDATPDEVADLGAIYVRLGDVDRAVELLTPAARAHPRHFQIQANLGTAWQLKGDLPRAAAALRESARLAPGKYQEAEEYHGKLVRSRLQEEKGADGLDDLFGVEYVGAQGEYTAGAIAAEQKGKLPAKSVAVMQQLGLWFPADARLLWQLAEVANAHGDVRYAANMMDGCVTQFNWPSRVLREHRLVLKAAVAKLPDPAAGGQQDHEQHVGGLVAKSRRPLLTRLDRAALPEISADGLNQLPWPLLTETELDKKYRPTFPEYLNELNGKKVTLSGFMQPFRDELDVASFMFIEYPIGCWYCEMPEMNGIILVETPRGETATYTRGLVRVTGTLILNHTDPEEFLYTIRNARVGEVD